MSNSQIISNPKNNDFAPKAARLSVLAAIFVGSVFSMSAVSAASANSEATARYKAERAVCMSGQSNQDRATCLKEAGAALAESKRGGLAGGQGMLRQNAMVRCNALPGDDREACERRIDGEGSTSGSVSSGGVIREIVTPVKK